MSLRACIHLGLLSKVTLFSRLDLNRWIWYYSPILVIISEEQRAVSWDWASCYYPAVVIQLPVSPSPLKFVSLISVFASSCQDQYSDVSFFQCKRDLSHVCFLCLRCEQLGPQSSLGFPWGVTQTPPPVGPCPSGFSSHSLGLAQKHKVEENWCVFCWVAQLLLEPFMLICMQVLAVAVGCCPVAVFIRTTE